MAESFTAPPSPSSPVEKASHREGTERFEGETVPTPGWTGAVVTSLLAGWMLAFGQMILSGAFYNNLMLPWRSAASVLIGRGAFETAVLPVLLVGLVSHFGFSLLFGILYSMLVHRYGGARPVGLVRQAAYGFGFGAVLWLVNFQVVARLFYPWLLDVPQPTQLVLHLFLFGLPLGMMRASLDRRLMGGVEASA